MPSRGRISGRKSGLRPVSLSFPACCRFWTQTATGPSRQARNKPTLTGVRGDLSLTVDGKGLPLRLVASKYAPVGEMRGGRGEIVLDFDAEVLPGPPRRHLTFTNHHQSDKAVYLVNGLVPRDPAITVTGQSRNYDQSVYQMDYTQTGADPAPPAPSGAAASQGGLGAVGVVVIIALALGLRRRAGA